MPSVSAELLMTYERPAPPAGGSPDELLNHAIEYGSWVGALESQVKGWQAWHQHGRGQ